MKQPNVILLGQVCIDNNTVEGKQHSSWGSPLMHMALYFQKVLGLKPTLISPYGSDFLPYLHGLRILPDKPTAAKTLVYENMVVNGARTQYCHNEDQAGPPVLDQHMLGQLADADILCVAPLTPAFNFHYLNEVMDAANPQCLKVLLPQGYLRDIGANGLVSKREFTDAAVVLSFFDIVILSDEDIADAFTAVKQWKVLDPSTDYIITQNARGASVTQNEAIIAVPTEPVAPADAKNPIGLGDVFSAATAYQLYATRNLKTAVEMGNKAARDSLMQPPA